MVEAPVLDPRVVEEARFLSCVACNYVSLLQGAGAVNIRWALGQSFAFRFRRDGDGVGYDYLAADLFETIAGETGFTAVEAFASDAADLEWRVADICASGRGVLLFGNGRHMAWTPFFGREDVEHTVIVRAIAEGRAAIEDTYVNNTKYGRAQPVAGVIDVGDFAAMCRDVPGHGDFHMVSFVSEAAGRVVDRDHVVGVLGRNGRAYLASIARGEGLAACAAFLAAQTLTAPLLETVTLLLWEGVRAREHHLALLQDAALPLGGAERAELVAALETAIVPKWRKLNEIAFLVYRRFALGKADLSGLTRLLTELAEDEARFARLSIAVGGGDG